MRTKRTFFHHGGKRPFERRPCEKTHKCVEASLSSDGWVIDRAKIYDFYPYWGFRQPKICRRGLAAKQRRTVPFRVFETR